MFADELKADLARRNGAAPVIQGDYGLKPTTPAAPPSPMALLRMLMGGPPSRPPRLGPAIAVIYMVGPIVVGGDDDSGLGLGQEVVSARLMARTIREVAADEGVKAAVVRVDSPGGSALASDLIWRELRLLDAKKPLIASFSDTAASGGYYVGAGARRILAQPGTVTGSIGVVGGKLVMKGLFDKIGLNVAVFEHGGGSTLSSLVAEFSEPDREKVRTLIEDIYATFLRRVAETRPAMDVAAVEKVAQGRVWTGRQALRNGLVDEIGDLAAAIRTAREAAGIPADVHVDIVRVPESRNLLEAALDALSPSARAADVVSALGGAHVQTYLRALTALNGELAACLMPAAIRVR
jgi:protease-4